MYRLQYHVLHDFVMNNAKIWLIPARPASMVAAQLNSMIYLLYDQFLDEKSGCLDIVGLKKSKEFMQFSIATAELQKVSDSFLKLTIADRFVIFTSKREIRLVSQPLQYISNSWNSNYWRSYWKVFSKFLLYTSIILYQRIELHFR